MIRVTEITQFFLEMCIDLHSGENDQLVSFHRDFVDSCRDNKFVEFL